MIIGKKILLDAIEEEHLPLLLKWRNDPNFRQYYREYRVLTLKQQKKWWKDKILNDDSWQYFIVKPLENTEKIIGIAGLTYIHPVYRTGEFAITLGDASYRGRGYGSDTLKTLINYGFNDLNLNKIWCEVYSNNGALDVYKHIGFQHEGTLRQHIYKNGKYLDSYILSMLKVEYEKMYKKQSV
jgi:hypothetical protein